MSAPKVSDRLYLSQIDVKTDTPGVYRRGSTYRVLTRPDGQRKVMRRFDTYDEAVQFKLTTPSMERRERPRAPKPLISRETRAARRRYITILRSDPCAYCGAESQAVDHVVPTAVGGDDHWTNFTAACTDCNSRKSAKSLLVFLAFEHGCWELHLPRASK